METTELNFLHVLKTDLELSDEKTTQIVDFLKKLQKDNSDSLLVEIKSLFKEEFHRIELKMEQNKSDIELQMRQNKSDIDLKFEQFDRKWDKYKSDIDLKFEQFDRKWDKYKSDIDLKFEQVNTKFEQFNTKFEQFDRKLDKTGFDLELKIEKSGNNSVRWFVGLSVAVMLMILGLYATIIFRFYV